MYAFVLIWSIFNPNGITTGSHDYATEKACNAAATDVKNANDGFVVRVTAICTPKWLENDK